MSEHKTTKNTAAKNKRLGIFLIVAPFVGLVLILTFYAISTFIVEQMVSASPTVSASTDTPTAEVIGQLINVGLGFLGIIFVIGIFIGIPIGIYLLTKKDLSSGHGSIMHKRGEIPAEVNRWNWGAFFLGWIWGLANGVWISLLTFIPIVNIFVAFYLGWKGSELAWQNGSWESAESFKASQRRWAIAGTIFFLVSLFFGFISGFLEEVDEGATSASTSVTQQTASGAAVDSAWYRFNSPEHSFFTLFPVQPTRSDDSSYDEDLGNNIDTTQYQAESDGSSYFIVVYSYNNEQMSDTNPDFSTHDALEGALNGMVNQGEDYKIISQNVTSVDGKDAIRFVMSGDGEILDGLMAYSDQSLYLLMADYYPENPPSPANVTKFLDSFTFVQ